MFFRSDAYKPEKVIWTEKDFENMGWHDSTIYAIAFTDNSEEDGNTILFDIDYIFKWIDPVHPEQFFSFWVSPCTLLFQNVFDLKVNIESGLIANQELEVSDIIKTPFLTATNEHSTKWTIELQTGNIEFLSSGYKQIIRKKPFYKKTQNLTMIERGVISFEQKPYK